MKKKLSDFIAFMGTKNLIAIAALLVLIIAISIGIVISNNKSGKKVDNDNEIEESTGLQVEENADDVEGDSIDFSEFQTEEEKKNDSGSKQEGNKNTQSGSDGQSGNDSGNGGLTESPSDGDNGDSGNGGTTGSGSESWGPFI